MKKTSVNFQSWRNLLKFPLRLETCWVGWWGMSEVGLSNQILSRHRWRSNVVCEDVVQGWLEGGRSGADVTFAWLQWGMIRGNNHYSMFLVVIMIAGLLFPVAYTFTTHIFHHILIIIGIFFPSALTYPRPINIWVNTALDSSSARPYSIWCPCSSILLHPFYWSILGQFFFVSGFLLPESFNVLIRGVYYDTYPNLI